MAVRWGRVGNLKRINDDGGVSETGFHCLLFFDFLRGGAALSHLSALKEKAKEKKM